MFPNEIVVRRAPVKALLVDQDVDFAVARGTQFVAELVFVVFACFVDFVPDELQLVFVLLGRTPLN